MGKIDTTNWGEFNLYDERLFTIDSGNKFDRSKMTVRNPTINFVGRTAQNNGINAVVDELNDIKPYEAGYITVALGGSIGASFVQPKPFYTSQNVIVLKPNVNMTDCVKRFICTAIQKESDLHYQAFVKELNSHIKRDFVVLLPVDVNGDPDWQYMEDYMRNIEVRVSTSISKLESAQGVENSKIDISNWGEFPLIELFDFYLSKGDNQAQKLDEGEIPLVSSGSFNNGICKYIDKGDGISELFEGNLITIDMFGQPFYQNNPFYSVSHGRVNILKPKFHINEYIGLFIVSVMQKMYYEKYGFATMCSQTKLKKECIKLPINSEGNPDWLYMENYMKALETKVGDFLNKTA